MRFVWPFALLYARVMSLRERFLEISSHECSFKGRIRRQRGESGDNVIFQYSSLLYHLTRIKPSRKLTSPSLRLLSHQNAVRDRHVRSRGQVQRRRLDGVRYTRVLRFDQTVQKHPTDETGREIYGCWVYGRVIGF